MISVRGGLGLAGGRDTDRPLAHDGGRVVGKPLNAAPGAVEADVSHRTGRHLGQRAGQGAVGRLHHSKGTARRLKAGAGSRQLRRSAGQQGGVQDAVRRLGVGIGADVRGRAAVQGDPL